MLSPLGFDSDPEVLPIKDLGILRLLNALFIDVIITIIFF